MNLMTQDPTGLVLPEPDGRRMRELASRAAVLSGASTAELADLLLDMPGGLRQGLLDFAAGTSGQGCFVIRGLPVGDLPGTPQWHGSRVLEQHLTTGVLTLVADLLGSLIGYQDEKDGALIHEVHPVAGEEQRIENSGSVAFDFHTENVHHPLRPDFLGLLCLRQDHEGVAATRVASVRDAAALLTGAQREILSEPRFRSAYPTSFARNIAARRPESGPHPVLFGAEPNLFMRFNSHTTSGPDRESDEALRALAAALEETCREIVLRPGEMVVVDNHVAAHGRSAFTPRYDGMDRWLRRCYSLRAVPRWAEQMMPQRRVLPELKQISGVL
ncbi:oxygenase [Streptomyces bathyalis]|uniref:Oxygenase n=1 Tax=Streptomyces bathyalis TaxID=2710756 RepID=A0A7T1T3P1_9ACTN|nr:TauD/TfdA family dioxygenase [Streptomyces bathyalis]QPP05842.1 oxygenase [Streptomyces bathyalis]